MEPLSHEGLTIEVSSPGEVLHAHWRGASASRNPAKVLLPWFQRLLELAQNQSTRIELHFEELTHFNSSTIVALIQVINAARDREIPMVVHYDGSQRWQAASFEALKRAMQPFGGQSPVSVDFMSVPPK